MENRRVNVRAIIWHNGKLLCVKHRSKDGTAAPYYAVPGGGLDPMEDLASGLQRELYEETGIQASIGRLLFIQQFNSWRGGYSEELEFFFAITNPEDFLTIDISTTTHGKDELAVCEFIDPRNKIVLPEFLATIDIAKYIATEKTPYIINLLKKEPR